MNVRQYQYLLNKDKKQVIKELGEEFNFYPADIWSYRLKKSWFGRKTILLLYFSSNRVCKVEIKKCYGQKA